MRKKSLLLSILLCLWAFTPATAQVSFSLRSPTLSIGFNVPEYPRFERVPGYPVYYAPELNGNYFFYDSFYWTYYDDNWYASSWYNGPWELVDPDFVPLYILRVPVRYYLLPPVYFHGWLSSAPPRWGQHWGSRWEQHRSGWDRWNRRSAPAPAPLPRYQSQYSGDRYPQADRQHTLRNEHYKYQPHDALVRKAFQPTNVKDSARPAPAAHDVRQPKEQTKQPQQREQRSSPTPPAERTMPREQPARTPVRTQVAPVQEQRKETERPSRQREPTQPEAGNRSTPDNRDNSDNRSDNRERNQPPKREQRPNQQPNQKNDHQQSDGRDQDRNQIETSHYLADGDSDLSAMRLARLQVI